MQAADDQIEDSLDVALHDAELLEEIRLMSELMVAASSGPHDRLPLHELDMILGLAPAAASGEDTRQVPQPRLPQQYGTARSR